MNVGLIGCGRAARIHLDAYINIENVKVIAVSDINLDRAKDFAKTYKIDKVFSNYKDLLDVKDLDLVDICTPTSTHETLVCEAARSGFNVLVEKPMARNTDECERIIRESEKHKIKVCVCHNQLFYPFVKHLKAITDCEDFDLLSFRTLHFENFNFLKAHSLATDWNISPNEGGILWEVGCHLAYLQLYFLNDIKEVYAIGVKAVHPVYDEFKVLLRTSNRRFGIMEVSWISEEPEIFYEISGSNGRKVQAHLPYGYIIEKSEKPVASVTDILRSFSTDQKRVLKKWMKFALNRVKKQQYGHFDLIRSYLEGLKKDQPPPATAIDGRNTIRLLECINQSLNEERPITVDIKNEV